MSYRVKIAEFEGPFQLLLHLVSQQKVDIGAISITEVADQYLAHIDAMPSLDMDVASDFLLVASTLLSIKAASLLPAEQPDELGDDEFEDMSPAQARDILIARLIAYKQFKNAAAALNSRMETEGRMHARQAGLEPQFLGLLPDYLKNVTLHNLAVICADLAARREIFLLEADHVAAKPVPVESKVTEIEARLSRKKKLTFTKLLDGSRDPVLLVVSFLAVLELYHRGMIELTQEEEFGEIELAYIPPEQWAPAVDTSESAPVDEYLESQNGSTDE
jgi:segregation and condensation protein A